MNHRFPSGLIVAAAALVATAAPSAAEDGRFQLAVRVNTMVGDGKPANDIPGFGLVGRYQWKERWLIGFAVDHSSKFDVERAPELVGLTTPKVIDAEGTSTAISGWRGPIHGSRGSGCGTGVQGWGSMMSTSIQSPVC